MDMTLNCFDVTVEPNTYKKITVKLTDVEKSELFENLSINDFLEYFPLNRILNEINEQDVKDHFDLINNPD